MTSDRRRYTFHGIALGLLAFVLSYVGVFMVTVLYRLDYTWVVVDGGPLADIGIWEVGNQNLLYLPGAAEMLSAHMPVWMAIEFVQGGRIGHPFGAIFPLTMLLPGLLLLLGYPGNVERISSLALISPSRSSPGSL